jgi:hypothetical protein
LQRDLPLEDDNGGGGGSDNSTPMDLDDVPSTAVGGIHDILLPPGASREEAMAWGLAPRKYTSHLNKGKAKKVIGFWAHLDPGPPPSAQLLGYIQPGCDGSTPVDARAVLAALASDEAADDRGGRGVAEY